MSKRIYIAGKYDDKDIVSCLSNIRKGLEMASLLMKKGYAVFCPFADFLYAFTTHGHELDKAKYQANSMAWVDVSDALLVLPGWETSGGTKREIARASEVSMGRYGIGFELKPSYFRQSVKNMELLQNERKQESLL